VPVKYNSAEYVHRFSTEALIPSAHVPGVAATVTRVIAEHMSPGQVAETLTELPGHLRETIRDGAPVAETGEQARPYGPTPTLDDRVSTLTEAVLALARGLEGEHATGRRSDPAQVARAARLAEEILVAGG
jgi:hypothetical protein